MLTIGDNPFNVAVLGDYLEETHEKRYSFQVHQNAIGELFICPNDLIKMDVAFTLFGTDQAVALERRHEEKSKSMDSFEVIHGGIPCVEKDCFGFDPFVGNSADKHFQKVIVLGLAITFTVVYAEVDGVIAAIFSSRVDQVYDANAAYQSVYGTAILPIYKLNRLRVLFVLDAVVQDQICVFAVIYKRSDEIPEFSGCSLIMAKEIADRVVARAGPTLKMVCQVRARVVAACRDKIFNILQLVQDSRL